MRNTIKTMTAEDLRQAERRPIDSAKYENIIINNDVLTVVNLDN